MSWGKQAKRKQGKCAHEVTVSVVSAGFERIVCEACGRVAVAYRSALDTTVDRRAFAREADEPKATESRIFAASSDTITKPLVSVGAA